MNHKEKLHRIPDRTGTWSDFPGSPVVKSLHSNARDASSIPDGGTKIPHALVWSKDFFFLKPTYNWNLEKPKRLGMLDK